MSKLNPKSLFKRIARDVPTNLHPHLFVTGSLAAAYHFAAVLEGRGINTKDVDLVVHPAGEVASCAQMAQQLLAGGWRPVKDCTPQTTPELADTLRAIRLLPPDSQDYFIEFLGLPLPEQGSPKQWMPVRLPDGWYGLPCFKFMGLTAVGRLRSHVGLEYAEPALMALSNLLAHPCIGPERMASAGPMKGLLRSAKDLGRVLALARLAGREETETWLALWQAGLTQCFPATWQVQAAKAGDGLRELLSNAAVLEEARQTTEIGLLNGKGVSVEMLQATGERFLQDVVVPLEESARS